MKRYAFLLAIALILFLSSCVETRPFRVGGDIDNKNQIVHMDNLEPTITSIAKSICADNLTNIAIGDFIDTLNNEVDKNGQYLAFDLQNKMLKICKTRITSVNNAEWITKRNNKFIIKPQPGFDYFILGTYGYTVKGYDMFVRVINLKTDKTTVLFAKKICNKKIEFDLDRLHIPHEVVIEPLW